MRPDRRGATNPVESTSQLVEIRSWGILGRRRRCEVLPPFPGPNRDAARGSGWSACPRCSARGSRPRISAAKIGPKSSQDQLCWSCNAHPTDGAHDWLRDHVDARLRQPPGLSDRLDADRDRPARGVVGHGRASGRTAPAAPPQPCKPRLPEPCLQSGRAAA
jgi:hypothetical protein